MHPVKAILTLVFVLLIAVGISKSLPLIFAKNFSIDGPISNEGVNVNQSLDKKTEKNTTHIKMPEKVQAVYTTAWVAATPSLRKKLVDFIDQSSINSLVIDVKDYTGLVTIPVSNIDLKNIGSSDERIKDIKQFIDELHLKGIYTIARIAVFQDPYFANKNPNIAVQNKDGTIWKDRKGLSWIDPGSEEYYQYIFLIMKEVESVGFDEINLDYIRYPTDGVMSQIFYPISNGIDRRDVMRKFWQFVWNKKQELKIPVSADIFGMTTVAVDDLGIGQKIEDIAPFVDIISPMVYPSHYANGFQGFSNPAQHPYEVIKYSMDSASQKLIAASSSPSKLRPWLQDFDLGADYGVFEVQEQIRATYESGSSGYMIWDPSNIYTKDAY